MIAFSTSSSPKGVAYCYDHGASGDGQVGEFYAVRNGASDVLGEGHVLPPPPERAAGTL